MLQIAVINESTASADADVQKMIPAFNTQWNNDLNSVWGVGAATFVFNPKQQAPPAGSWWVVFLDNSDQGNALAYHDLTNEGLPISKVFVKTIQADKSSLSVGASHEICEMAVDPWLNSAYQDPQGTFWAGEICDPVEADNYGYEVGGILVTDFVTPNWFGHKNALGAIDLRQHANKAFQVLSGGYAQKFDPQKGWVQVTGAEAARTLRGSHAAPGSRRERRARGWQKWVISDSPGWRSPRQPLASRRPAWAHGLRQAQFRRLLQRRTVGRLRGFLARMRPGVERLARWSRSSCTWLRTKRCTSSCDVGATAPAGAPARPAVARRHSMASSLM